MSHEIVGERFKYQDEPAWHQLGAPLPEGEELSVSEAIGLVTEGVKFVKTPIRYNVDGHQYVSDKQFNILRLPIDEDPKIRELGIVGSGWKLAPYQQCGKIFDKLSKQYPVETVGLIKHGGMCFVALKADGWDVMGDEMVDYITLNLSMQPGITHRAMVTPVRVVCNNTNLWAIERSSLNIKIPHDIDSLEQLALASSIIAAYQKSKDQAKEMCEALAKREITVDEALTIFQAAFPTPAMPRKLRMLYTQFPKVEERRAYTNGLSMEANADIESMELKHEQNIKRTEANRELVRGVFDDFDTPKFSGTAWAAYNSVTAVADHREGRNRAESSIVGARAQEKVRAFSAALALVG